jgi:hypothetical protein
MRQATAHIVRLKVGAALEGSSERDFIGIFEISTDR